jgi:hypothetical protein
MVVLNWLTLGGEFVLFRQRFPNFAEIEDSILAQDMSRLMEKTGEVQNPSGAYLPTQVPFSMSITKDVMETMKRYDPSMLTDEVVAQIIDEIRKSMEEMDKQKPALYYGVLNSGGIEALMSAELWLDDDHPAHKGNIRGGGKNFWLNWCQNGGRDGSSMPFSVWLCPADFQFIKENNIEGLLMLKQLRKHEILDTPQTFMAYLWPWSQHYEVISERVRERMRDEEDTDDTSLKIEIEEFTNYASRNAQTRGPVTGFIYPRVRWKS